jgi:hypothetical protein
LIALNSETAGFLSDLSKSSFHADSFDEPTPHGIAPVEQPS